MKFTAGSGGGVFPVDVKALAKGLGGVWAEWSDHCSEGRRVVHEATQLMAEFIHIMS